ncbi:MAG: zeta toxin family protein [Microbacterium sp.]|uniref:zeta toxin family protein n=1 Tax=Microbacterium sp. TaxID=51671 RepID=UPI003F9BBC8E
MSGELRPEQLRARFERRVVPHLEEQRARITGGPSWPPVLVYTGGQPGAGKSRANERAAQSRPTLVPVIGDDLRQFHPDYVRLMREDPLSMPEATAQASGRWIGMSADYLREQRADVLIETTLRSPDAMASTIASFREAGYVVELRVVAVPHEISRLGTVERYTGQVEAAGVGRWTPAAAHDEAFARGAGTARELIAAGAVDRFVIEDRAGAVVFDRSYFGIRDDGLRGAGRDAAVAFERARGVDRLTPAAARGWIELAHDQVERVARLDRRDPDLLATVNQIGRDDGAAVAARAYPADPARAREEATALRAAARDAIAAAPNRTMKKSLGDAMRDGRAARSDAQQTPEAGERDVPDRGNGRSGGAR